MTLVATLLAAAAASSLRAQVPSPITDLLNQAKESLNNLQYDNAKVVVRQVLNQGTRLKRLHRTNAFQVIAAAYFPEDTSAQRADSALKYLRMMVREAPDAQFAPDLAWHGLDSLLAIARGDTFGGSAAVDSLYVLQGSDSPGTITAVSNMPARFHLLIGPRDRLAVVEADSSTGAVRTAKLRFRAHDGNDALLRSGEYEVRVLIARADRPDTIVLRYLATANGIPPTLRTVPTVIDSARLLPERARPARPAGVALGIFLGGITFSLAHYARGEEPLKSAFGPDSRATSIGAALAIGAIAAGVLDRGRPLPGNVEANKAVVTEFKRSIAAAIAENKQRVADYRVQLTIDPEAR